MSEHCYCLNIIHWHIARAVICFLSERGAARTRAKARFQWRLTVSISLSLIPYGHAICRKRCCRLEGFPKARILQWCLTVKKLQRQLSLHLLSSLPRRKASSGSLRLRNKRKVLLESGTSIASARRLSLQKLLSNLLKARHRYVETMPGMHDCKVLKNLYHTC